VPTFEFEVIKKLMIDFFNKPQIVPRAGCLLAFMRRNGLLYAVGYDEKTAPFRERFAYG